MCPQFLADELRVLLWEPELGTREFDDLASARKCIGKSFRLVPALEGPRHEFKIALGLRAGYSVRQKFKEGRSSPDIGIGRACAAKRSRLLT